MQILVLANVPPGAIGGAEIQSLRLAHCWASAGHSIIIAGPENLPREEMGISILRIPILRATRFLRGMSYGISTLWLLWSRRRQYDLVYCRFLKEHAFIASIAKLVFRLDQPLVSCPACSGNSGDIEKIRNSVYKSFIVWVFDHGISCVNAISQNILEEIRSLGLSNPRFTALPNGVNIPQVPHRNIFCYRPLRIIFVGRLVQQKGLDIFLKAISMQKNGDGPDFEVLIIGDGPLRYQLEQTCDALDLKNIVHFIGPLPHDKVLEQLAQSTLFVLPSRFEGMPGALLEAIAEGLPVVVTSCGGSEEIIDASIGWVVPPEDAEALAKAIDSALDLGKEALQEMGQRAHQKAIRDYEISSIANQHLVLFSELISANVSN